ncbi:hypothetical protein [Ekhidna sp.]|uniref:hypothetical protein n=1 Tax=Ekhidna sp. TaxID=2608089 RepID=UPI0035114F15
MKKLLFALILAPIAVLGQYTVKSKMVSGKKEIITTNYIKGYVVDGSGKEYEGEIQLKIVNTDTTEIRYKGPNKEKLKFDRMKILDYGPAKLLVSEVKNDYKNEIQNFHPGYIVLSNGKKVEGMVASRKRELAESDGTKMLGPIGVKFADESEEITEYMGADFEVSYYMQNINGEEYHFVNAHGVYVTVENPNGRFSYFRNPKPTHVREGATNLTRYAVEEVTEELAEEAAQATAQKSFESSMNSGESLSTSVGNATADAMNVYNGIRGAVNTEDMTITFREYYIVDNKTGQSELVYKKNVEEVLNKFLGDCGVTSSEIEEVARVTELDNVMVFLKENACD